jgi:hypothetical protein
MLSPINLVALGAISRVYILSQVFRTNLLTKGYFNNKKVPIREKQGIGEYELVICQRAEDRSLRRRGKRRRMFYYPFFLNFLEGRIGKAKLHWSSSFGSRGLPSCSSSYTSGLASGGQGVRVRSSYIWLVGVYMIAGEVSTS